MIDPKSDLVAYFSMEFGISDNLPIYAGGLGILAGDMLHEASDQKKNLIGIGLFYHQGNLQQQVDAKSDQLDKFYDVTPQGIRLQPVLNSNGEILIVDVPIADRLVKVRAWKLTVGRIPLYLLDTRLSDNSDEDQHICDQLYSGNKEHRLQQEMILGIGGIRFLTAANITPSYYHLNEAHSAFAILEVASKYHKQAPAHTAFSDKLLAVKPKLVFTNHTLVSSGNDSFPKELIAQYLTNYAISLNLPFDDFLSMGQSQDSSYYSLTHLALNYSVRTNAVSTLHAKIASSRWSHIPFIPITNGIYLNRWLNPHLKKIWPVTSFNACSESNMWSTHKQAKTDLLSEIKVRTDKTLNPEILTVVWARRITNYKRPRALLYQLDRLKAILNHQDKPVQIVVSGKVHPNDEEGKQFIKDMQEISNHADCNGKLVFVPNYDINLARLLVAGADVWLNTPLRGYEACGTSGMKACLNGVLQMTIKDGWTDDVEWSELGWTLDDQQVSESIYSLLESEVSELFYKNRREGIPLAWAYRMIESSYLIRKRYSATRMLDDYYRLLYL